jgi:hypothetical protein
MRRSMMLGVYAALSLGAVDIAFSLTRFLTVQLTSVDDFRSITIIGESSFFPQSCIIAAETFIMIG